MPKVEIEVGSVFKKVGVPTRWEVEKVFELPEGPHVRLFSHDDKTRKITLAADAVLDRRVMIPA